MVLGYLNIIHNWVLYALLVSGTGLPEVEDGNSPFPLPDIYFVKIYNIKYTSPAGDTLRSSLLFFGSGVLTTDGQFIVSRSLVEPWNYAIYKDTSYRYRKELLDANIFENTFNYKITGRVQATTIKGDTISFRIEDRKVNTKPDRIVSQTSNGIPKDFYLYTGTPVFFLDEKENEYKVIGLVGLIKNQATVISLCSQ